MQTKKSLSPEEAVEEYFDMLIKSRFIEMFGTVRDNTLSLPVQKMGDVVEIRNGRDYKVIQNDNGRYPVYGTGGIITYADDFLCPENTVIIGRKGTIDNPLLIKEKFWNVDTAFGMICNQLILNPIYYFWFCKQYDFKKHNKATTIPSLVKADLQKIDVIVPEKYKQDLFADFVKQVDKSKAICKQIFQSFDNLVKSRFIEMFGDESIFKQQKLGDLVEEMFIGPFGSSLKNECFVDQSDGFCIVYEQKHAIQKTLNIETRFVTKDKYLELQRFNVHPGDIIVSCRGTIGETFIIPENAPLGIMHPSIMKIRLKPGIYNTLVFNNMLKHRFNTYIDSLNGSSVKMAITAKDLGKQMFPIPDIHVQNQFADFVEQVDKSKFEVVQSLLKLKDSMKSSQ